MNQVWLEVEAPESIWVRGSCNVDDSGLMRYKAKFCRAGSSPKPMHLGPIVSLVVLDSGGKEVGRKSVTLGVKSSGDLFFQTYTEASAEVEKVGLTAKE